MILYMFDQEKTRAWARRFQVAVITLLVCLLAGCATGPSKTTAVGPAAASDQSLVPASGQQPPVAPKPPVKAAQTVLSQTPAKVSLVTPAAPAAKAKKAPGNPFAAMFAARKKAASKTETAPPIPAEEAEKRVHAEFAFDNADLYEVLDATLFELYKVNYMVDPTIKAKVTFHVTGDYTRNEFINILNNVLQLNNLAITEGPGGIYKIVQRVASAGSGVTPVVQNDVVNAAGDITRMIRLRYLAAGTALSSIRPFLSRGAVMVQNPVTNALVITDTPENISRAAGILSVLDQEFFSDVGWRVFPVKMVDAEDIAKDLDKVLKTSGLYNRPGMNPGSYQIVPIKSMNALLVVSRWPSMLNLVQAWLGAMDHSQDSGAHVFVYFVENGLASDLADVLRQLYGGSPAQKKTSIVKPVAGASKTPAAAPKTISAGEKLSGDIDIIADETNNAIIFKGTERDYQIVKKVLKQLDIVPRQVLINVVVAEITLSNQTQYGVEWFLQGFTNNKYTVQGVLDNKIGRTPTTALGTTTGFTLGVYDPTAFMRGLVSALGSASDVNILSSPNVLAVDNKEATIEVGEEIPTVTGQVTDLTAATTLTNTIQYRKTGILLKVTPHINSSGLVKMNLSQEVSDKGSFYTALNSYSILSRKVDTSLVAQNGQTIVLGGLIKSNQTKSNSGIPLLKDIPLLGALFKAQNKELDKTELILLITPHVVNNREEAEAITQEFSKKVNRLKELVEKRAD